MTAATYLKNLVKMHWSSEGDLIGLEEKREFRNQLVDVLLRVDGLVLKLLAEAVSCPNPISALQIYKQQALEITKTSYLGLQFFLETRACEA